MESLRENKLLMYAILASSSVVILLTTGISEELNNTFEIIQFPDDVSSSHHYELPSDLIFVLFYIIVPENTDLRVAGRYDSCLCRGSRLFVCFQFDQTKIRTG